MKPILFLLLSILFGLSAHCQDKLQYLGNNRQDLNSEQFEFPQKEFTILGFGAYHGSRKTEEAELSLLSSLTRDGTIKYYLPETDFSIAHYFNAFLNSGDTILLQDLIMHYGSRVPQERSIAVYEKWKAIKNINDTLPKNNKLTVVGIDLLVSYKYAAMHLLELIDKKFHQRGTIVDLNNMLERDTTNFFPYSAVYSKKMMEQFVNDYEANQSEFDVYISDQFAFDHIVTNLKGTFVDYDNSANREALLFENYKALAPHYHFETEPQFARFGFFHIEKQREGSNPSFFVRLIESGTCKREDVLSVIGYLTKSRVLWDVVYDDNDNYQSYTTEAGFGIGDYDQEYFLGIDKLKSTKISDLTLFRLNQKNTPYADGNPDLMEIVMKEDQSNGALVKGKSTTEFLDYAILISESDASVPMEELFKSK